MEQKPREKAEILQLVITGGWLLMAAVERVAGELPLRVDNGRMGNQKAAARSDFLAYVR